MTERTPYGTDEGSASFRAGAEPKDLAISDVHGAHANIPDLKVYGDGDTFALLAKASSRSQGWMKSTKVANVSGGCLVQVTTQQGEHVAEALTYVPGVHIDKERDPRRLVTIGECSCCNDRVRAMIG